MTSFKCHNNARLLSLNFAAGRVPGGRQRRVNGEEKYHSVICGFQMMLLVRGEILNWKILSISRPVDLKV